MNYTRILSKQARKWSVVCACVRACKKQQPRHARPNSAGAAAAAAATAVVLMNLLSALLFVRSFVHSDGPG